MIITTKDGYVSTKPLNHKAIGNIETCYEPHLPLPYVHYPDLYEIFITYSTSPYGEQYLCACQEKAVRVYLRFNYYENDCELPAELSLGQLNAAITKHNLRYHSVLWALEKVNFKADICHLCNVTVPYRLYCHPMYGTLLEQHYGWFTKCAELNEGVQLIEYGIDVYAQALSPELTPLLTPMVVELPVIGKKRFSLETGDRAVIKKLIQNEIRGKLGIGTSRAESFNEKILLMMVKALFSDYEILSRTYPPFLSGLELDIYIPSLPLAIEYQGKQHYKAINFFGGADALNAVKKRDAKKMRLCKKNEIPLIKFNYREVLSWELVKYKLADWLSP